MQSEIHNLANLNPLSDVKKCDSASLLRDENEFLLNTVEISSAELIKLKAENNGNIGS